MYKNKKKLEIKYIILIIIVIIITILVLFSYILKDKKQLNPIEKIIKDSSTVVTNIIMIPFDFVAETIEKYSNYSNIYDEYKILKEEEKTKELLESQLKNLQLELEELKKITNIENTLTEYDSISARVTIRNNGYWYNTITINKGSTHGIKEDMAVVTNKGLIGKTTKVSYLTSEVRLITTADNSNNVSSNVLNQNQNHYGIINSYDSKNNLLFLEGISNTINLEKNSKVVTSGLGGVYPSGILIGTVSSIKVDNYGLAKLLEITPSADFNNISYVNVLVRKS